MILFHKLPELFFEIGIHYYVMAFLVVHISFRILNQIVVDNREYVATICIYCAAFFDLPLSNFWIYPLEFLEYISGLNMYCWYLLIFDIWNSILSSFFHIVPYCSSSSIFLWLSIVPTVGILSCIFELIFGIFIEICNYLCFLFLILCTVSLLLPFLLNIFCNILFLFLVLAYYFFYTLVKFFFP